MSHVRETTLFVDFLKNPSIMPLGFFLVSYFSMKTYFVVLIRNVSARYFL